MGRGGRLGGVNPVGLRAPNPTQFMIKGTNLKQLLPDVAFQEVLDKLGVFRPVM